MIQQAIIAWLMPVFVAVWFGYRWARDPAETPGMFLRHIALAALTSAAVIFAGHLIWVSAMLTAIESDASLAYWTFYWTGLTALLWLPILVITYVLLALKWRREARGG